MAERSGPLPPAAEPAILHVDMDAFFAAVEVLDDPALAGTPVIVGGSGWRGVVASCTYEARAFGVRSAMPSVRARQLCPDAVFVAGRYARYAEMSARLRAVLLSVTPLVEPIGLDEAFLDVSGARRLLGRPAEIAGGIRDRVLAELSLPCSIGVGRSKLVAKLASRAAKPVADRRATVPGPGVVVVDAGSELAFLHPMPVEALWGVGPATASRLHALGLDRVGDLARCPPGTLERLFGRSQGAHLANLSRAHDPSPVVPDRPVKSVGHEETFSVDVDEPAVLAAHAVRMSEAVAAHLRGAGTAGRTVTVKVRFADFATITRAHTLPVTVDTAGAIAAVATALLEGIDPSRGVRLLGVTASGLSRHATGFQLAFDIGRADATRSPSGPGLPSVPALTGERAPPHAVGPSGRRAAELQSSWSGVTEAVDAVRRRFGDRSVGAASMVSEDGLSVPAQREQPWGPDGGPPDNDPPDGPGGAAGP